MAFERAHAAASCRSDTIMTFAEHCFHTLQAQSLKHGCVSSKHNCVSSKLLPNQQGPAGCQEWGCEEGGLEPRSTAAASGAFSSMACRYHSVKSSQVICTQSQSSHCMRCSRGMSQSTGAATYKRYVQTLYHCHHLLSVLRQDSAGCAANAPWPCMSRPSPPGACGTGSVTIRTCAEAICTCAVQQMSSGKRRSHYLSRDNCGSRWKLRDQRADAVKMNKTI